MSKKEKLYQKAIKSEKKGKPDEAINLYLKILEEYPEDMKIHLHIAEIYSKKRNISDAIEHYKSAASICEKDGYYPKAFALYKQILGLNSSETEAIERIKKLEEKLFGEKIKTEPKEQSLEKRIKILEKEVSKINSNLNNLLKD